MSPDDGFNLYGLIDVLTTGATGAGGLSGMILLYSARDMTSNDETLYYKDVVHVYPGELSLDSRSLLVHADSSGVYQTPFWILQSDTWIPESTTTSIAM